MFTIKAKPLCQLLTMVSEIDTNVKINLTETGLSIKLQDSQKVTIGVFSINQSAFEAYTPGESFDICAYQILNIIRHCDPEDLCTLKIEGDITSLEIGNKWFNVTIEDEAPGEPRIPMFELPVSFRINPKVLCDDLRSCAELDDEVTLSWSKNNVTFIHVEDGKLEFKATYPQDQFKRSFSSKFSLCWIIGLLRGLSYNNEFFCDEIKVSFGNDFPLTIEGQVNEDISFMYMLAPRIELV